MNFQQSNSNIEDSGQHVTNINQTFLQNNMTANFGAALSVKCLSCNGRPGSAEGGHQFPPSNVFCKETNTGRVSPAKTRPISPGYVNGNSQSTTRKKLMNYYEWLRGKSEDTPEPSNTTATRDPADRSQSPPPRAPVGTDRRFYAGVTNNDSKQHKSNVPDNPPAEDTKAAAESK
eukprot:TRINITY_DN29350_c0_g1_i1.p1 TRINITY_DN29350_c0_g1~~TRINITY_DN29350_c0_g1_i1.p1  ORF type:complete len:195 (+),score=34.56 TRINITY_DN29350_c0_g1_i1:62-586(+)